MDLNKLPKQTGSVGAESFGGMTRAEVEKQLGIGGLQLPDGAKTYGVMDLEDLKKKEEQRRDQELLDRTMESTQRMARQVASARAREDANTDYLRRSAEASEEVLAEERRKRAVAELAAKEAKADKEKAEERAERAERREGRMERLAVIGLFGTVAGLSLAAWPYFKEAMGW